MTPLMGWIIIGLLSAILIWIVIIAYGLDLIVDHLETIRKRGTG